MVNFSVWIFDCNSHNSALLDLFLASNPRICSTVAFLLKILIMLLYQFPLTFLRTLFHLTAYDYSHADWEDLQERLRDIP